MAFTILYVTNPDEETARKISQSLIEQKLIACANFIPIGSCYFWQGKVENDNEIVSILKTTQKNQKIVSDKVVAMHPYDVPCVMALQVEANKAYENWIATECSQPD